MSSERPALRHLIKALKISRMKALFTGTQLGEESVDRCRGISRPHAAVGSARRHTWAAARARHHQRRAAALRGALPPLPGSRSPRRARSGGPADIHQCPWFRRRDELSGIQRLASAAGPSDETHRARAGLAADEPGAVRSRADMRPNGALFVGSPAEVVDKILAVHGLALVLYLQPRSGPKKARISCASAPGCSRAAKWPPRVISLQRRISVKVRSASDLGGRRISRGKAA